MIKTKREKSKEEKSKTLEEIVSEQSNQIQDLQSAIDDIILNGGAN